MSRKIINTEIDNHSKCPCGSGKKYIKCCKKQAFKWKKDSNGNIIKEIPISPEVIRELEKLKDLFITMFGRAPASDRVLFYIPNDRIDFEHNYIRIMRNSNIDEKYIYAYYKTGITVTKHNKKLIPDNQYVEWLNVIKEYDQLINDKISESINIIMAIAFANDMLKNLCSQYFQQIQFALGMFISIMQDERQNYNSFRVCSIVDYLAYCAHKTQKNLETMNLLITQGLVENALATVRFIFELYLNVTVYVKESELFNEKVLPLAGLDNGTHSRVTNNDNSISMYKIKDDQTNTIYDTKITIKQLACKSGIHNEAFYSILYNDLSQYVHVDVLAAKKYFSFSDPFYEVDECLIAGFLSIYFSMQLIFEICNCDDIPTDLKKDLIFFANKIKQDVSEVLDLLSCIDELPFYATMRSCLENGD